MVQPAVMGATEMISPRIARYAVNRIRLLEALRIYYRYRKFTMQKPLSFVHNLQLCAQAAPGMGCVVECGVWRGGMSAGIADMLPGRVHYLFDSYEGLPPAKEIDGESAKLWQKDRESPIYYDNCRAEKSFADTAMRMSAAKDFQLLQGWFCDTIPGFVPVEPIAILRFDCDWYDSNWDCLINLYPHVAEGGLVIINDYYTWDGCARAVHDFLSTYKLTERIDKWNGVWHFIKRANDAITLDCWQTQRKTLVHSPTAERTHIPIDHFQ
jgi:O-methyltransferase